MDFTHNMLQLFLLFALLVCLSNGEPRQGLCRKQKSFNNKLMDTYRIERHEQVTGLAWCAVRCLTNTNCGSFFYHKVERFCQLHSVLFITPSDAVDYMGTWYFEMTQDWCPDNAEFVLHRSPELCYKVKRTPQNYTQAQHTCQLEGGSLLKVKDADISFHMFEFLLASSDVRTTHFLVGADDNDVAGQYRWIDGDLVTWTNWAEGEPSSADENCLALAWFFYFQWNDIPCINQLDFICQIDRP